MIPTLLIAVLVMNTPAAPSAPGSGAAEIPSASTAKLFDNAENCRAVADGMKAKPRPDFTVHAFCVEAAK
jgi:hypothetical protein